jgi:hypothetical protein
MEWLNLKNAGFLFMIALALFLLVKVNSWFSPDPDEVTITVQKDSTFAPIEHRSYQPSVLPFSSKKPPVKLPSNVRERDVERVVTVETEPGKPIDIIETKDGEVYVAKDTMISRVVVTKFQPPLFAFGLRFGAGLSVSRRGNQAVVSPSAVFAPLEWNGWLHLPSGVIDLDGIGVGGQARIYHDIYLGAAKVWRYDDGTALKLTATFMF